MAKMNPYLNFDGKAEEAFNFYKSVFGTEFDGPIHRIGDTPGLDGITEEEKKRVMHVSLPIGGGDVLMASDTVPSMGHKLVVGNNNYISLHPTSREEADKLFNGLSAGGDVEMPLAETFWGAYFGSFKDKFGVQWMINYQMDANN
ncbi:VOC family protein [Flavihumibacter solisilvae]|uniref:Glyoxalase n=1 Tax=Flavihumibacter solisilvae TaxID=1349421 RepID=A0A0C1I9S3_9BACT|nr:VOC family protein [Flavihumibacter solisilvae]KIC90765.1 glyoxalase [Flavihumibacter solisilvae]